MGVGGRLGGSGNQPEPDWVHADAWRPQARQTEQTRQTRQLSESSLRLRVGAPAGDPRRKTGPGPANLPGKVERWLSGRLAGVTPSQTRLSRGRANLKGTRRQ